MVEPSPKNVTTITNVIIITTRTTLYNVNTVTILSNLTSITEEITVRISLLYQQ